MNMLTFVNATYAYVGVPPAGQPKCKSAGKGCVPYAYDPATGVVQVGDDIVGKVARRGAGHRRLDRGRRAGAASCSRRTPRPTRSPSPPKGTRLAGVWHFRDKYYPAGIWAQSVTFRKNGTYDLYYQVGDKDERHSFSGTYAVTKPGQVVFKSQRQGRAGRHPRAGRPRGRQAQAEEARPVAGAQRAEGQERRRQPPRAGEGQVTAQ